MNNEQNISLQRRRGFYRESTPPSGNAKARSLITISDSLNALHDDYAIVREVADGVTAVLNARAVLVMISSSPSILYAKHRDYSDALARFERTLNDNSETVLSFFARQKHKRVHVSEGLVILPLHWNEKTIGLMVIDRGRRMLTASDQAGVIPLCNQLAAIFGLKSQSSATSHTALQCDITNAVTVQQGLLPAIPPSPTCGLSIAAYTQAADFVGGDYFDLILVDGKKMGVVVADVEGKGVPAALFGNLLRTTTHFLTRETPSTSAVMTKINSILHNKAVSTRKLFTMFYAVFDPETKTLTYTGSGHVSPLLLRNGGKEVIRLHSDGTLIGVDPVQRFSEHSVQLESNDVVVYFTDGVTEHRNTDLEAFGVDRLMAILKGHNADAPETLVSYIKAELARFSPHPFEDDVTMVVTKIL